MDELGGPRLGRSAFLLLQRNHVTTIPRPRLSGAAFRVWRSLLAFGLLVAVLLNGTIAFAGTTGALSGVVTDAAGKPVAGARVNVASPSQTAQSATDANGQFQFLSLGPDTYSVTVSKAGYADASQAGVTVIADQTTRLTLTSRTVASVIGRVSSRSSTDLVKAGTTADVYSVNATQAAAVAAVGGGGGLNNAYSAIATVPGALVPIGQSGWFQTVHVRGGDYDQTGYELDGVPVNRSFDNYPSGAASSLGQQELQVYTGATPATSEGAGIAGYINQVIRSGTSPGFANLDLGDGGPSFYHKASFEVGGATPNRLFSYYVGFGGYDQSFRYYDQFNGASLNATHGVFLDVNAAADCGSALAANYVNCYAINQAGNYNISPLGPGGFIVGPYNVGQSDFLTVRNNVVNLHFGIPHGKNGLKDDLQLLYVNDQIETHFFSSYNDLASTFAQIATSGTLSPAFPAYQNGFQYNGPLGVAVPTNYQSLTNVYQYPNANGATNVPADTRDAQDNGQAIFKVQYQFNINDKSYLKAYAYTYYSTYLSNGPLTTSYLADGGLQSLGASRDYELSSHTRGVSLTYANQLNDKNLLTIQGASTTATTLRDNNAQMRTGSGYRGDFAVLVNANNPFSGVCYNAAYAPVTCLTASGKASFLTLAQAYAGTLGPKLAAAAAAGNACGGPCEYVTAQDGTYTSGYNTVRPHFGNFAVTDEFRPNSRTTINAGIRYDSFEYTGADTTGSPTRQMFINSYNLGTCTVNGSTFINNPNGVTGPCPAGYTNAAFVNTPSQKFSYQIFQPRIGATYQLSPNTVLRGSYGEYVQAPNTAFEQYDVLEQDYTTVAGFQTFQKYGFNTPGHPVRPQISYNTDFSLEHQFAGTDISFKLTPFLRKTRDQLQTFFLDQQASFESGLNVGRLTAEGVEFAIKKGDFNRNGLSGSLSFTYTNAYNTFDKLSNGSTVIDGINNDIKTYNAYTKTCATSAGNPLCGGNTDSGGHVAAACYTSAGLPDSGCGAGSVANPYWNAPIQSTIDPNAKFAPFDLVPGSIGSAASSYNAPYFSTLVLNYKHDRFAFTPSLQFVAGIKYGAPETTPGIDPAAGGCTALGSAIAGDPRYQYGAPGGAPYDATTCAGQLAAIPNQFSKVFDGIGAYTQPAQLALNASASYQLSKKATLVASFSNILNRCFGGTKAGWTTGGSNVCSYNVVQGGNISPAGNFYNPGASFQQQLQYPYQAQYGGVNTDTGTGAQYYNPFSMYFTLKLKV